MTINDALLSVYPDQIVAEPIKLGTKLELMTDHNSLFTSRLRYDVYRGRTGIRAFTFDSNGVVYANSDVELSNHEKRVITKIIGMWRDNVRPDWETFESMRAHPACIESATTLVPVVHNTL